MERRERTERDYTEFGKAVKMDMIALGLKNKDLAKALGYTESTVCDLLRGRNKNEERRREILKLIEELKTKAQDTD